MEPSATEKFLEQETTLLFAVDQPPFQVPSTGVTNTFSLLVPLMTETGRTIERSEETFPRRGRVWWMLRPEIEPSTVLPGMLWSGTIEHTKDHKTGAPEKDWYQINRRSATRGSRAFLEVLDHAEEPDPGQLLGAGLRWRWPTLGRVVVRGPRTVLGPFRANYDHAERRVRLEPLNPGEPWVYRLKREELERANVVRDFSFLPNQHNRAYAGREELRISLLNQSFLETFEAGEKLDGATDTHVINVVLKRLRFTRKEQQALSDVLRRTSEARAVEKEEEFTARMERFRRIVGEAERVASLGAEAAELVGGQEAFRELLDRHKDSLVQAQVKEEVDRRRGELEKEVAAEEERRDRVRRQIEELEELFDRKSKEHEERFQKENEARLKELAAREAGLGAREAAFEERARQLEDRLERVLAAYRTEAERIGDQLLVHIPLLRRAGLLGGAGGAEQGERSAALPLPAFLSTPRGTGDIDEPAFLEQFEHVAARRGFAFERDDLVHFHLCVKTGPWTVLAGPSGLGKSSISRLYAEALGASEEHLLVPVRPDWLDDRDVIGAFNSLTGRYEPAATGLVDHLIAAQEDLRSGRGGLYLVCLDEMNLARVEHYFAAFLSVLEQPPEGRRLRLFAQGLERPGDPYAAHRLLPLGPNLRFIGTVNIDETTHFFSPKVLDRCPIVSLERTSLKQGLPGSARPAATSLGGMVPVSLERYLSWIAPAGSYPQDVLDILGKVDSALQESHGGLGFRVRNRILEYVASGRALLGEERALDLALFSNVAPRLRPNAPHAERTLATLRDLLPAGRFPRTAGVLLAMTEAGAESDFFGLL